MKHFAGVAVLAGLAACGTHLSAVSLRDEQAGQVLAAGGMHRHPDAGDPDNMAYTSIFCKGRAVLIQAGEAYSDAGACK